MATNGDEARRWITILVVAVILASLALGLGEEDGEDEAENTVIEL